VVARLPNRGHNSASSITILRKPLLLQRYQLNIIFVVRSFGFLAG
jgi:hypothetical protein